jgi:hypothetical protein
MLKHRINVLSDRDQQPCISIDPIHVKNNGMINSAINQTIIWNMFQYILIYFNVSQIQFQKQAKHQSL